MQGWRRCTLPMLTYGQLSWAYQSEEREEDLFQTTSFAFLLRPLPRPAADTNRAQASKIEFEQWRNIYSANIHWRMGGISSCSIHIIRQKAHRREMSFGETTIGALTSRTFVCDYDADAIFRTIVCASALLGAETAEITWRSRTFGAGRLQWMKSIFGHGRNLILDPHLSRVQICITVTGTFRVLISNLRQHASSLALIKRQHLWQIVSKPSRSSRMLWKYFGSCRWRCCEWLMAWLSFNQKVPGATHADEQHFNPILCSDADWIDKSRKQHFVTYCVVTGSTVDFESSTDLLMTSQHVTT